MRKSPKRNRPDVLQKQAIRYNKRKINIPAKSVSFFGKIFGLMFKSKNTENLLFKFKKKTKMRIHSFFVFFPFLAVWTDKKNKVIKFKIVKPFSLNIGSEKPFNNLIEIPPNKKNKKIFNFFVDKKDLNRLYR